MKFLRRTILLLVMVPQLLLAQHSTENVKNVIVDLDTGNEVDDLYALARILLDSNANVTAINATHWQTSHWAVANTMENSHRLNQQLLAVLNMKIKTNRGGMARMYDWGDRAQHSAAAYEIIKQANGTKKGERLDIIALGALTNVASAVFIDPDIEDKINLYWLGSTYDFENQISTQTDFNCIMDIYALQHLLRSKVRMHILPLNTARGLKVSYERLNRNFRNHDLGNYLMNRWDNHLDPLRKERVLWDLALIEAYLRPDWAKKIPVEMSRDYSGRQIDFYTEIDAKKMMDDFEKTILRYKEN